MAAREQILAAGVGDVETSMADPHIDRWTLPFRPELTIGWVIQAGEDEPLGRWLRVGKMNRWGDASSGGKEPGQLALFLQSRPGPPAWMGWGHVLEAEERWRVLGVSTTCDGLFRPPLGIVDSSVDPRSVPRHEDLWENRALGSAVGLLRFRNRTPYREVGSRDLRLTVADLHLLARVQPALRSLPIETGSGARARSRL